MITCHTCWFKQTGSIWPFHPMYDVSGGSLHLQGKLIYGSILKLKKKASLLQEHVAKTSGKKPHIKSDSEK